MKRLNRKQQKELEKLHQALADAATAYNAARTEFESFREDIVGEAQAYFEERSDRWQESEAGEQYQEWINVLEEEVADEVDEDIREYPTSPDEI